MSGVEFLQTAVTEIAKPVVNNILQELDYLLRPQKYINKMNLLVQPLKDNHKIVDDAVVEARRFGKDINPEVEKWLETAGDIIAQAELLLDSNTKRCLNGWCVDFGSRYKINKGAVEISDRITKALPPTPESKSVAHPPPPPTVLCDPDFMEFESTKETMQQITVALKDAECGIVGIFGMGGIGKTTIVKKIAEKVKQDKQFDQVVMAVVSQSPDLKKIQDQIASMLDLNLDQRAEVEGRASQLRKRLMNAKTILVILDDLWARLDLTKIGIPGCIEHKGCKVLLTTRSEDVCTSMGTGNGKKIKVGVLSKKESWELFKSNAGDGIDAPPLKEVAAKVMNECQGLPLALKTVGRALRDKEDIRQWESAELQLKNSRYTQIDGMSKEVISCLRLSYDYLESDEMKACFLVCCLLPEDEDIPNEILVRYAIGKGLFGYVSTIDEARTLTKTTLRKLKASCLLLEGEGEYAKEEYVKVHDVVRDVGLSIALEDKLVSINRPDLGQWLQRNSMKHVKEACFATNEVISLPEGIQCPELEELIMLFGEQGSNSDTFFQTMKKLKVLIHLGPSRLPTSLKYSVRLRTLHLVECELGDISATLGELKMLEILSINSTDMESLPVEVGQLRNLRLLDLLDNDLKRIPGNVISQLSRLEELWIGTESFDDWEIEEGRSGEAEGASLSELQSLPRLAILCIGVREFAQFPPRFSLPNKLVKFKIRVGIYRVFLDRYPTSCKLMLGKGSGEFQMEGVKSLLRLIDGSSSSEFTSNGNGSRYVFTDFAGGLNGLDWLWIGSGDWISYLTRCATANDKVVPPVFANLQELRLRNVLGLRGLGCGGGIELEGTATSTTATGGGALPPGSLQHLKVLDINSCDGLEGWAVPSSWTHRLQSLESVKIGYCSNVKGLFEVEEEKTNSTRIRLLSNLREMRLKALPQLRSLTNGKSSSIHFSNLRDVQITKCPSLVSVFTPNVVSQGLVHLEALKIVDCRGLKAIFEESDSNSSSSQETQTSSTTTFPNLKSVYVEKCEQLKCLFTVSMANGLPKLEELQLRHNRNLEEIVCCNLHRAAAVKENVEINDAQSSSITWPQIRKIEITNSMQLKRFCPENSYIEMPMLQEFRLVNCSDWMENFAADPPAHGLNIPQSAKIYILRRPKKMKHENDKTEEKEDEVNNSEEDENENSEEDENENSEEDENENSEEDENENSEEDENENSEEDED